MLLRRPVIELYAIVDVVVATSAWKTGSRVDHHDIDRMSLRVPVRMTFHHPSLPALSKAACLSSSCRRFNR